MKKAAKPNKASPKADAPQADRFMVSSQRGRAKGKVRYVETNAPKGCKFL